MNYPNTVAQRSYYRQTPRRKTRHFVVNGTKLAMLIIPIVLLAILMTFEFSSHGTDETSKPGTVQANGNGINPGSEDSKMLSVSFLPYIQDTSAQTVMETTEHAEFYTDREVELIAKTVYGEALVTNSDMEMAAVVWCILNRADSPYYPDTIEEVVTQRRQFHGYNEEHPVTERIENIVRDVLDRWYAEKDGVMDSGRVLPKEYIYFEGDGSHNHYSAEWKSGEFYDWSLPNPYES